MQNFSTLALLTFELDNALLWGPSCELCAGQQQLWPLPSWDNQKCIQTFSNVSGGQNHSSLRTTNLREARKMRI